MREETLLLGIPKVLTAPRLARALATPLAVAALAAATAIAAILTVRAEIAFTALAWSAGALLLMRPDEAQLDGALHNATSDLRRFLTRRTDVRTLALPSHFLSMVNPLDDEHGWPTLVLLGGLPRGGWHLLAVPPLLAASALFVSGATLVVALPVPVAVLLLLSFAAATTLLGLDAYASMLRGTLIPLAPEAARGLRDTLVVLAAIETHAPPSIATADGLTGATEPPDVKA